MMTNDNVGNKNSFYWEFTILYPFLRVEFRDAEYLDQVHI